MLLLLRLGMFWFLFLILGDLQVKFVHEAMEYRAEHCGCNSKECQSAVQGIERREKLASGSGHGIHRAHTGKDHGSIQKRIYQFKITEIRIAAYAQK